MIFSSMHVASSSCSMHMNSANVSISRSSISSHIRLGLGSWPCRLFLFCFFIKNDAVDMTTASLINVPVLYKSSKFEYLRMLDSQNE